MRTAILGATLLILSCTAGLQAQFSSSGSFGSRTLGGGISNPNSFGAGSPASSTGITNGGSANGAFGSGSSLGGGGNTTGAQGMQAGQVDSSARYLPQNRQGAFVGADRGDTLSPFSQQSGMMNQNNASQNAFFNQLNQQMRRNQQMQQQQQRQNQQGGGNRKPLRVSMKVGFVSATPVTNQVTAQMSSRLTKLPGLKAGAIAVVMDSGTAVLTGRVATEYDRELAEGVALLEPGIESVRNELVVDPAVTTAPERAPPIVPAPAAAATTAAGR